MLVIGAKIKIKSELTEEIRAGARKMVEATLTEPGCIEYSFAEDFNVPGLVRIFEVWETKEALKGHFSTPHMAEFGAMLGGLETEPVEATLYEISGTGPVDPSAL